MLTLMRLAIVIAMAGLVITLGNVGVEPYTLAQDGDGDLEPVIEPDNDGATVAEDELYGNLDEIAGDTDNSDELRTAALEKMKKIITSTRDPEKRKERVKELIEKLKGILTDSSESQKFRKSVIGNINKLILVMRGIIPPNPKNDPTPANPNKDKDDDDEDDDENDKMDQKESKPELDLPFIIARDEDTVYVWNPFQGEWGFALDTVQSLNALGKTGEPIEAVENVAGVIYVRTTKNIWHWDPFTQQWEGPFPMFDKPIVEIKDLTKDSVETKDMAENSQE